MVLMIILVVGVCVLYSIHKGFSSDNSDKDKEKEPIPPIVIPPTSRGGTVSVDLNRPEIFYRQEGVSLLNVFENDQEMVRGGPREREGGDTGKDSFWKAWVIFITITLILLAIMYRFRKR